MEEEERRRKNGREVFLFSVPLCSCRRKTGARELAKGEKKRAMRECASIQGQSVLLGQISPSGTKRGSFCVGSVVNNGVMCMCALLFLFFFALCVRVWAVQRFDSRSFSRGGLEFWLGPTVTCAQREIPMKN